MSTNSLIGKEREENQVEYVYCHWDGYIDGVGNTLSSYYDSVTMDELLKKGDLSSLGMSIDYCEFYADRGESDVESRLINKEGFIDSSGTNYAADYRYLYTKDNEFVCYTGSPNKKPKIVKL